MRAAAPASHDRSVGPQARGEPARSPRVRRCDVDQAGLGSLAGCSSHGPGVHRVVGGGLDALIVAVLFMFKLMVLPTAIRAVRAPRRTMGDDQSDGGCVVVPGRRINHVGLGPGAMGVRHGGGQTARPVAGRGVAAPRRPWPYRRATIRSCPRSACRFEDQKTIRRDQCADAWRHGAKPRSASQEAGSPCDRRWPWTARGGWRSAYRRHQDGDGAPG